MDKGRIGSLDSLRGIAALIVVGFHCLVSFELFHRANYDNDYENGFFAFITLSPLRVLWAGNEAVLLFFVLSGFVLSIPFFKGKQPAYPAYLLKRFVRIYLPFIVVVAGSIVLATLFMSYKDEVGLSRLYENRWDHQVTWGAILSFIFMIPNDHANVNGVVWSLYHEMRISVVLPLFLFIIYKFKFIKALVLTMAISGFGFVFFHVLKTLVANEFISVALGDFRMSAYYAVFFIFGAFLSRYKESFADVQIMSWWVKLGIFVISLFLINSRWLLIPLGLDFWMIKDTLAVFGVLAIFTLVLYSDFANRFLTKKPLLWLGQISYSLYLVHIPVIMMTTIFLGKIIPMEVAFIIAFFLSIPIAALVFRWVEVPSINIGRSLSKKLMLKLGERKENKEFKSSERTASSK